MAKLGYTWYPKDWGNSEKVFELTLIERGLYRELIDMAMLNDNKTVINYKVWARKFGSSLEEVEGIIMTLHNLNLIELTNDLLFIPSCEPRLNIVRGASNGGKKSKPTKKSIQNLKASPTESLVESLSESPIETKRKEKKGNRKEIESKIIGELKPSKLSFFISWLEYRKEIKKPIVAESTLTKLVEKFNSRTDECCDWVVSNSIENNYQGLFWDNFNQTKVKNKPSMSQPVNGIYPVI